MVEAFYAEEIGVGHALLLAKLQPSQQEQALTNCFREEWNGGAITSRPDLFAAAIDGAGMSDMLREVGPQNIVEFGSVKTQAGFESLYAMSAYHHVKDGTAYPAVLLETGANDTRVDPAQVAKMAARLQEATSSHRPVLLRVDYQGGHGGVGGTRGQAEEIRADEWSFLLWQFGVPDFQPALGTQNDGR